VNEFLMTLYCRETIALLTHRWLVGQVIPNVETIPDVTSCALPWSSFVLVGESGAGKSVVLACLALAQAERLLQDDPPDHLPVLVPLNRYRAFAKPERFLAQYLASVGDIGYPAHAQLAPALHERLESGQLLLLLDGLDELPRRFRRCALRRWQKFIRRFGPAGRGNRVIVATKALQPAYALGLPTVKLLPLAAEEQQNLLVDLLGEEDGLASWDVLQQPELRNLLRLIGNPYWLTRTADVIQYGGGSADSRAQLLATWVGHVSARASAPSRTEDREAGPEISAEVLRAFGDATLKLYRKAGDGAVIRRSRWIRTLSKRVPAETIAFLVSDESPFLEKEQLLVAERHSPDPLLWFKHDWLRAFFAADALRRRIDEGRDRPADWRLVPPDGTLRDSRLLRCNAFVPLPDHLPLVHVEEAMLVAGRIPTAPDLLSAMLRTNPILAAACALERGEFLQPDLRRQLVDALLEAIADGRTQLHTRIAAGNLLGCLGDPRQAQVVSIPKGSVVLGSGRARHVVEVPAFKLFRYLVTRQEYARFAASDAYDVREWWTRAGWRWRQGAGSRGGSEAEIVQERPNHPITDVTWYEAIAYANWLSSLTGTLYRLPTEAEWERAAKGTTECRFPWGDDPDPTRANTCTFDSLYVFATTPIGTYPAGEGRFGAHDQAGNVWEWCTSHYLPYPYDAHDGREILQNDDARVIKGGSWLQPIDRAKCHIRGAELPEMARPDVGFRLIEVIGQSPAD